MPETRKQKRDREYGSAERLEFVKALPCVACGAVGRQLRECHHTRVDGTARKAGYKTIVPLCFGCHTRYHAEGRDTFRERMGIDKTWAELAAETEAAWLEYSEGLE